MSPRSPIVKWREGEAPLDLPASDTLPESVHVFDRDSVEAINAAISAKRPLLIRGEPGVGKSQLARAAAVKLGRVFLSTVIDARTEARDLMWSFDAVTRLAEAQIQGALGVREEATVRAKLSESRFLRPGPLWWAFDWMSAQEQTSEAGGTIPERPPEWTPSEGVVLLIDEIDKADGTVPNGLLEALGQGQFSCPGGRVVSWQRQEPPLVILTTNEERSLPDPFLRRCLVLQLGWKEGELANRLVERGEAHFPPPRCSRRVLETAAVMLLRDREVVAARSLAPPGCAEYLDILRVLADRAPADEKSQLALLERVAKFALNKHPAETTW